MTKKSESESTKKNGNEGAYEREMALKDELKRKRLLVRVAGSVASGIVGTPSPKLDSAEKIATVAVDVAEAILQKVGL